MNTRQRNFVSKWDSFNERGFTEEVADFFKKAGHKWWIGNGKEVPNEHQIFIKLEVLKDVVLRSLENKESTYAASGGIRVSFSDNDALTVSTTLMERRVR